MRKLLFLLTIVVAVISATSIAQAQESVSTSAISQALLDEGRYVEGVLSSDDSAAIDEANGNGIAFVWLNQPNRSDNAAPDLASELRVDLRNQSSQYSDVFVLIDDGTGSTIGLGAASATASNTQVDAAVTASSQQFLLGDIGAGIREYSNSLSGQSASASDSTSSSDSAASQSSGGGIGFFGLLLLLLFVGGGLFLLFRVLSGRKKAKKVAASDMAADRAEIQEQLKNNADRVITLGDEVIAKKDDELIRIYEEASASYQEVSTSLAGASTPEQVDELDNKIDKAEWQFDVIEAKLNGKPAPLSPSEREAKREVEHKTSQGRGPQDKATSDRPALGRDESLFPGGASQQRRQSRPRSGGFGGGGLGGGLGSVLGSILMGGSLGGARPSRRTQRRRIGGSQQRTTGRTSGGFSDPFGGAGQGRRRSSGGRGGGGFSRGGRGGGGFKR